MPRPDKKNYLITGLTVAILSFVLLFVGIKFILGNEIVPKNIVAFVGFSILAGTTASLLILYKLKIIFTGFIIGLTVGFILMYRIFLQEVSDWKDLIGLLSLFIFTVTSLGISILVQLGYHLFRKWEKRDKI